MTVGVLAILGMLGAVLQPLPDPEDLVLTKRATLVLDFLGIAGFIRQLAYTPFAVSSVAGRFSQSPGSACSLPRIC